MIPAPTTAAGRRRSNRMCLGSELPGGATGKVYLMRNVQRTPLAVSGYEIWDVTNVASPVLVGDRATSARRTSTGGSARRASRTCRAARRSRRNPAARGASRRRCWSTTGRMPIDARSYIRTFGLPGGAAERRRARCPTRCTARSPRTSIRKAAQQLARGATARRRHRQPHLLGVGRGRRRRATDPRPQEAAAAALRRHLGAATPTGSDRGRAGGRPQTGDPVHVAGPGRPHGVPGLRDEADELPSFTEFATRDIVLLASESTADRCATRRRTGASSST